MSTVGKLKEFLKDYPNDTPILIRVVPYDREDGRVGYDYWDLELNELQVVLDSRNIYNNLDFKTYGSHTSFGNHLSVSEIEEAINTRNIFNARAKKEQEKLKKCACDTCQKEMKFYDNKLRSTAEMPCEEEITKALLLEE